MFTLYVQQHCSTFTGQCMLTASPQQYLICSYISGLCVFVPVSSHQSSIGPLAYSPQVTALCRIFHFCSRIISCHFTFISYTCINPAIPQYHYISFIGLYEGSPSSFPPVHQLWSATHLCEDLMSKASADPYTWELFMSWHLAYLWRLLYKVLCLPYSLLF